MKKDNRGVVDADRNVGTRIRERRITLGLTQQQLAELVGVTYQQVHKIEKGINRVSAGRLAHIAEALGAPVGLFFDEDDSSDDMGSEGGEHERQRIMMRDWNTLPREQQTTLCALVRAMASTR